MIKSTLVALALLATVGSGGLRSATSLQPGGAGAVLATEPVALPPFADLPAGGRSVSQHEYERARSDSRFEMLRLTYLSDGLRVIAFVYKPSAPPNKLPVIVYNRGSYVRQNAASELVATFHRLAEAGFVVVAPMYRGSEGAPAATRWAVRT